MSYQTWHEYGYGICVDDIETTANKVFELIHLAPNFEKEFYNGQNLLDKMAILKVSQN